MTDLIKVSPLI